MTKIFLMMSNFWSEDRKRKMEEEIVNKIDYSGKANITFGQNFSFYMQALDKAQSRNPGRTENMPLIDQDMFQDLQQACVLNWCRTADPIYPVRTKRDGNCLCHAVSIAIWGIPDERLTVRNLVNVSIDTSSNKQRWQIHYEGFQTNRHSMQLNRNEWEREWKHVIETASPIARASSAAAVPYSHLEAIHIFTLANILRRPIIVLADITARTLSGTSLQESDIGGIYLPLNWPPGDCHKYPIFLGYAMNHFCPLLPQESVERSTFTVPVVTRDGFSLPIRFLTSDEEKRAANHLKSYLKIKEVALSTPETMTLVLSTEMKTMPLPNSSNIITSLPPENIPSPTPIASAAGVATTNFDAVPCITPGCQFYGSPATGKMCSSCLNRYIQQESQQSPVAEPSAPPPSMPMSGQFLSMMGETCKGGCGYRCSTQTYPYCHECAERLRVNQSQTAVVTESSLFGTGTAAQQQNNRNPAEPNRCRGEGCDRHGKHHLGELCDKCYMEEERRKQICSSPGCTGLRVNNGYCLSCQPSHIQTPGAGSDQMRYLEGHLNKFAMANEKPSEQATGLSERHEESGSSGGSSSSLIESGLRCNIETVKPVILTGPEDKIKCASPMCNTLIYPPNKLCKMCIDILMQSQATSAQEQQQQRNYLEPTVVSIKEDDMVQTGRTPSAGTSNSTPVAVRQHMMNVKLSETSRPSSAPIGKRCLTTGCTRFGDPSTADLCTVCYQGDRGSARSSSVGTITLDPFQAMMARVESQKRCPRPCKAAHCTNYGNPSNEGFCNSCYPRYQMMKFNL